MGRFIGRETDARQSGARASRRTFLRRGGLVAAGGVAAAAALPMASAGAGDFSGPVVPVYLPFDSPVRVVDTRGGAKIQPNQTRLYSQTGSSTPPRLALTVNLTATETVGSGFLAVYPGGISWPGTSSVNWFTTNQDVSNNAFFRLQQPNETFNVRCGGIGPTHYVIDIVGAIVAWDTAATAGVSTADAFADMVHSVSENIGTWQSDS